MTGTGARRGLPDGVARLARGGAINLVGAAGSAVFTFVAFVLAARLHSPAQVGAFTVAIAVFTILRQVAMAGAQVGFTRFLPMDLTDGAPERVRTTLRVGTVVVLAAGLVAGAVAWTLGEPMARLLGGDADAALVEGHLRWMAAAIPLTAVFLALTFATRGMGTMTPATVVDNLGRAGLQLAAVAATGWLGAQWLGAAWALPYVVALPVLVVWLRRLLRDAGALAAVDTTPVRASWRRFWRFSGPRGVASTLQVAVLWADTILLGVLAGAEEAGIYSIATRFLVVGSLATGAVMQVAGPRFSELLTKDDRPGLQATFRTSARWVIWLVFPAYLVLATLPEPLLRVFGEEYVVAAPTVTVLALATCVGAASGAVDMVLLMSGRSMLSLGNWAAALAVDIGLAIVLIPRYGILGAAIAWAVSIVVRNIGPLAQVRWLLHVDPFGPGYLRALLTSGVLFGLGGLVVRSTLGATLSAVVTLVVVGGAVYAALLVRWRHHLYVTAPEGVA